MGDELIRIIDELTNLTKDEDLFYLEIPLEKAGLWVADSQIDSRFNGVDYYEFDIYYRGKSKSQTIDNIKYFKYTVDSLGGTYGICRLQDGTDFKLEILYQWDYLEKDSEGYFVFTNRTRLYL